MDKKVAPEHDDNEHDDNEHDDADLDSTEEVMNCIDLGELPYAIRNTLTVSVGLDGSATIEGPLDKDPFR